MRDLTLAREEIGARLEAIASQIDFESDNQRRIREQAARSRENLAHLRDLYDQFLAIREGLAL